MNADVQPVADALEPQLARLAARIVADSRLLDGWTGDLQVPLEELRCELDTLTAAVDRVGSLRLQAALAAALEALTQAYRCMGQRLFLPALCCAVTARQTLRRLRVAARLRLR